MHVCIISATIHVDYALPCSVLSIEKRTAGGLDATSITGSCRNVFQLEVLRLRLLLGRLLANMEAAAAAAALVSGRGPSSGPLSETCALPRRSSTVQETVQVGQDDNQGQWRQVERGRRTNRADPQADQARRESLAQKLILDTAAPNMEVHAALFKELLAFQFASPGTYGLDELWDGTQLKWQCADLHAGVSRHAPLLYELESPDPQASNYWAPENRMVGEVNYVQLFQWIKNQSTLWQEDISITECSPIPANVPIFGVSSVLGYLLDVVIWGPSKRLPRLSTSQLMQVAASTKFICENSLGRVYN